MQQRAFSGSCFGCGSERTPKKRVLRKRPRAGQHNPGTVHEDGRVEPPLRRRYVPASGASVDNSHKWFRHRQVYLKLKSVKRYLLVYKRLMASPLLQVKGKVELSILFPDSSSCVEYLHR